MSKTIKRYGVEITLNPMQDIDDLIVVICFRFTNGGRKLVAYVSPEVREIVCDEELALLEQAARDIQGSHKRLKKMIGARAARTQVGSGLIYTCDKNNKHMLGAGTNADVESKARVFIAGLQMTQSPTKADAPKLKRLIDRKYNRIEKEYRETLADFGVLLPRKAKRKVTTPRRELSYGLLDT